MNLLLISFLAALLSACTDPVEPNNEMVEILYTFPKESEPQEGTWMQWPHHYQYGVQFRDDLDPTWIELTRVLATSENVHIIAYDRVEQNRITDLLNNANVDMSKVDFKIFPNDDFWIRDNGPIYVHDPEGNLAIQDWGFNGWGNKTEFENCDEIPSRIGQDQNRTVVDLNNIMINEGGSVELDGNGTLMACKSSILNSNRNPGMTQA